MERRVIIDKLTYLSACLGSAVLSILSVRLPGTGSSIYRSLRGVPLAPAAGIRLTGAVAPLGHCWLLAIVALVLAVPCVLRRRPYRGIAAMVLALLAVGSAGLLVD